MTALRREVAKNNASESDVPRWRGAPTGQALPPRHSSPPGSLLQTRCADVRYPSVSLRGLRRYSPSRADKKSARRAIKRLSWKEMLIPLSYARTTACELVLDRLLREPHNELLNHARRSARQRSRKHEETSLHVAILDDMYVPSYAIPVFKIDNTTPPLARLRHLHWRI